MNFVLNDKALGGLRFWGWARRAAAVAVLGALAACGGGEPADDIGPPPDVSLRVSTSVALRGEAVELRATAYASNGMDSVKFYRLDFGLPVLLATVLSPPPNWVTSVPINAGSSVTFFARACDLEGFCGDSNLVTVEVYP